MDALLANSRVREVIEKIVKEKHTELSVGIVYGGREYIFEYQKRSDGYYDIGSLSKILTSLIILKAARDGLIDTDASIDKYLVLKDKRYPTIKQLLKHNTGYTYVTPSGITIPRLVHGYARKNLYRGVKNGQVLRIIERMGYRSDRYGYSDFSYALLCLVIEQVYGRSYGDVLKGFVREEFGLEQINAANQDVKRKDCYLCGRLIKNWVWEDGNPYIAAGGICATIRDMTSLVRLLTDSGKGFVEDCFAIEETDEKHNSTFFLSKNRHAYFHVGGVGTFRSSLSISKKQKIGVVIFANHAGCRKGNVSYLNKMIYNYLRRKKIELQPVT